jgi:uncharacterized protein YaaN involved in tellurite resistance
MKNLSYISINKQKTHKMTVEQIQKLEQITETLERLQMYINRETYHLLLQSKKGYISDMFKNIDDMIFDMYDHDTKDIMDAGINDLDVSMFQGD